MTNLTKYYLWLSLALPLHYKLRWDIICQFGSPDIVYHNSKNIHQYLSASEIENLSKTNLSDAEDVIDFCTKKDINIYSYDDPYYPQKLKDINSPPLVIFSLGKLENISFSPSCTVIGSRKSTLYSEKVTQYICKGLAEYGFTIISGFARGIDQTAHISTIKNGGKTIAVLGCGLFYDYPKGCSLLKNNIAENGAVISEFPPYYPPDPINFRQRNRICAGLADAVLCTQASNHSGSLNTVSHALSQGKTIMVTPPHDIFDNNYSGIISLLRDGAEQVYSADDIINLIS